MKKPSGDAEPASKHLKTTNVSRKSHKANSKIDCSASMVENNHSNNASNGDRRQKVQKKSRFGSKRYSNNSNFDMPLYAALDLGTNNCRLLVAKPTRRSFLVIDAFSRIIRLGEGLSKTGSLSDEAISRTLEALKICSSKMARRDVRRSRLVATEACRIANNSAKFIDLVKLETGLQLEIISRETEARLAVSGCASLLDKKCDWVLIFDIGGGSSELIWLDLTKANYKNKVRRSLYDRVEAQNSIASWTSLPIGVVKLAEKFGGKTIDQDIFEAMVQDVLRPIKEFESQHRINDRLKGKEVHFLGTSGTVTTVAGIHLGLDCYDRNRVDGLWMDLDEVKAISQKLIGMSYDQRIAQPCIGIDRADLVLAGCAILEALMRAWPSQRLRVADRGLREGILACLMAEDKVTQR